MHEDERALRRACAASPADDLPRLVLADWLDEHGQADHARFIRLQVEAAKPDTAPARKRALRFSADALLAEHRDDWEGPVRTLGVSQVGYDRGLPVAAVMPPNQWLVSGDDLFHLAPSVAHLHPAPGDPHAHRLVAASTHLIRLRAITFSSAGLGDAGVTALAANPATVGLRHLAVRWDAVSDAGADALAGGPHLAGLERLDLFGSRLDSHAVRRLAHGPLLARLTGLDLGANPFGDAGAGVLASAPSRERLTALGLAHCGLGVAGLRVVLTGSGLPAVAELDLSENPLGDAGAGVIANAPRSSRLTRLALRGTHLRPTGLRALADSRVLSDELVIAADGFPAMRFAEFRDRVRDEGHGSARRR